ncbi:MAG: type I DNA topoisomerase [Armatimonadetes bacterium]|nr:type I DNA topoisomerase [Armatimonadota bacterium]
MAKTKSKQLVIVESPAKAKTLSRFLGDGYRVEASYGHVRDLPEGASELPLKYRKESWAQLAVNVDAGFEPIYVVSAAKKKHVKRLKEAMKGCDSLLLATDEDREGESISWHVLQLLSPPKTVDVKRIVFHEVTKEAVLAALDNPRQVDEKLVRAQEARRVLDRLYGYTLSPLLWKKVAPGLSAGRVQSVAVRLAVERERERIAFVPATFWDLRTELRSESGSFEAKLVRLGEARIAESKSFDPKTGRLKDPKRRLLTEKECKGLADAAHTARPWTVTALQQKPGKQSPAPPFITSTLQQEANRKLRFTSKKTMRVAQQLYEGMDLDGERVGLITYMRTDSLTLAERALKQARELIKEIYGPAYLPKSPIRYKTKARGAQEAHEAIRPTDLARKPQDVRNRLDKDQFQLYELIWKRTVACQMVPARLLRTNVEVTVEAGGRTLAFAAAGRQILFPGFLRAYVEGSDDPEAELGDRETLLPKLAEGQALEPAWVRPEGHITKPPQRYTESSLVKRLEEAGIGRPSTYATIISTIQDRGYIFKKSNELVPTFTAFCVTMFLEQYFRDLVEVAFTARMEDELDEIAAGRLDREELVAAFYRGTKDRPGLLTRVHELQATYPVLELGQDPASGDRLAVRIGRYGPYVQRGEGGKGKIARIPEHLPPDELTVQRALELVEKRSNGGEPVGQDSETGRSISLQSGRYGDYLELAATDEEKDSGVKPKRVSLPKDLKGGELTPEIAQSLIRLPRPLGTHPDTGEEISTGLGRYGPYVKRGDEFRSLKSWKQACDMSLEDAIEVLKQPKADRRGFRGRRKPSVLKEFGELDGAQGAVKILDGRWGPYVTDGSVNASLPKGADPAQVTPDDALKLLSAKRAAS